MPRRYKVVKSKTRSSAIVNGNSRYALKYLPGTKVFADPKTLGIMTFIHKTHAVNWANYFSMMSYYQKLKIIEVDTIGRGKIPKVISSGYNTYQLDRFYDNHLCMGIFPIDDTICYPGVYVCE